MAKLTIYAVASLGIGIFGIALISEASSQNTGFSSPNPIVQSVPRTLGATADYAAELISIAAETSMQPTGMDLADLLRVDERRYEVNFGFDVSREILSFTNVRKIGFGQESLVSVATTPTGTYSTDGLTSPHVLYPGVDVLRVSGQGNSGTARAGGFSLGPGGSFCVQEGSFTYCN
jgi:hypothetical protein